MSEPPHVAPFNRSDALLLERAPNGGWIVTRCPGNPDSPPMLIGAFGGATQMLAALSNALAEAD